jgi:hypothetical protein
MAAVQYDLFTADAAVASCGLGVFNDARFSGLRPLARKLFTAPASSAASERVFSKAGIIMGPTRSRLSKETLCKLVFLSCNQHILLSLIKDIARNLFGGLILNVFLREYTI